MMDKYACQCSLPVHDDALAKSDDKFENESHAPFPKLLKQAFAVDEEAHLTVV